MAGELWTQVANHVAIASPFVAKTTAALLAGWLAHKALQSDRSSPLFNLFNHNHPSDWFSRALSSDSRSTKSSLKKRYRLTKGKDDSNLTHGFTVSAPHVANPKPVAPNKDSFNDASAQPGIVAAAAGSTAFLLPKSILGTITSLVSAFGLLGGAALVAAPAVTVAYSSFKGIDIMQPRVIYNRAYADVKRLAMDHGTVYVRRYVKSEWQRWAVYVCWTGPVLVLLAGLNKKRREFIERVKAKRKAARDAKRGNGNFSNFSHDPMASSVADSSSFFDRRLPPVAELNEDDWNSSDDGYSDAESNTQDEQDLESQIIEDRAYTL